MLGLLVDNAAHLLHHWQRQQATLAPREAMAAALHEVGGPMLLSSGMLALGFGVAATSELASTVEFAWLAVATILLALLTTAALLPVLSLRANPSHSHAD